MAVRSYLVPGEGYLNETIGTDYFIPGWGYVNETSAQDAITYAFSGPTQTRNGNPSGNIFLTPVGGFWPAAVTITLTDTAGTPGTFTPSSLTPTVGTNTPSSFVYTPAIVGSFTLVAAAGGTPIDPSPWPFTSYASSGRAHGFAG